MAKRVVYRENDNIDYEERAKYAAMSREELDKLLKEDDVMILRQLEEAAAPLPEKPEMKVLVSTALVESSKINIFGFFSNALAIQSLSSAGTSPSRARSACRRA